MTERETKVVANDQSVVEEPSRSKSLASKITGWTNNLLATALVVVIALVVGRQLVGSYQRDSVEQGVRPISQAELWPDLESCVIEFGDHPYQLVRSQVQGDYDAVMDKMLNDCRNMLRTASKPVTELGAAEKRMLDSILHLEPWDQESGRWRVYQGKNPKGQPIPIVVGIRDDCEGSNPSRLVAWGLGLPAEPGTWTSLVYKSAKPTEKPDSFSSEIPIPSGSRQTLKMGDHNGGMLVGFAGGSLDSTIAFYQKWAESNGMTGRGSWKQTGTKWNHLYSSENGDQISVQLSFDENNRMKGLLFIQPGFHSP